MIEDVGRYEITRQRHAELKSALTHMTRVAESLSAVVLSMERELHDYERRVANHAVAEE